MQKYIFFKHTDKKIKKMTHTEQTFLEINISGENAKDDALGKITGFIEQNPGSELLLGGLVIGENKDGSIRTELHFDMERPDTQRDQTTKSWTDK